MRAVNSVGAGDWSPIGRGTPVAAASPPSAPTALTVTAGDEQLVVNWQAPADDGAAIDVLRSGASALRAAAGERQFVARAQQRWRRSRA